MDFYEKKENATPGKSNVKMSNIEWGSKFQEHSVFDICKFTIC